jgi:TonB-linked SusC/RagA family outer membrane protein
MMRTKLLYKLRKTGGLYNKTMAAAVLFSVFFNAPAYSTNLGITEKQLNKTKFQDVSINGQVKDNLGQPLPGVSVSITGTTIGTVTDVNGNYRLNVPDNYASRSIAFTFIGFVSQQVPIGNRTTININLKLNTNNALNEVVVVGYGTQSRANINGAVSSVGAKDIENKPVTNTYQALQGESPNLIIQQSSLDPGSNVTVNIRGVGTLGNNDPLVVIDGIVTNDPTSLNTINPNDIASVTVLKDAGSAAIYGSRAANGVLLVTTKSGKLNQKTTVSYNGSYGLQNPNILVHKVDAWDNAYYKNESLVNAGLPPAYTPDQIQALKDQGNGTWDINHLLYNAPQQSQNVSVSGGGASNTFFIAAGYQDQKSNYIGNGGSGDKFGYQKYNLRLNQTAILGKFRLQGVFNYTKTRNKTNSVGNNNILADANRVPYNYSWQDANGNYLTNPIAAQYNEYGILQKGGYNQADNDEVFGNLNAQLNITKDLKLTGVFGGTIQNNGGFYQRKQVDYLPAGVYGNDFAVIDNNSKSLALNTQLYAEYNKSIADHNFSVQLGATSENYSQRGFSLSESFTDPLLGTPTTGTIINTSSANSIAVNANSLLSVFGRARYNYKNKYSLGFVFREDASSKFAKGKRSGFFPSVDAGWLLSDETFMQSIKNTVNFLKLRASYGILGNQNVGNYQYQTTYFNYASAYGFNNTIVGGAGTTQSNPNLTWEKAATFNIGTDISFFDSKLTGSFDYFNKVTSDILQSPYNVPLIYGATPADQNVAKVRTSGWEAQLTYNLKTRGVTQSFSANIADNKNKLLQLSGGQTENIYNQDVFQLVRRVGEPVTQYYGYETNGFFQNQADITNSPKIAGAVVAPGDLKFKDLNGDGVIDAKDKTTLGNPFPRYTFGFTYILAVAGFDLQVFFQGVGERTEFLRGELVEPYHYNYGATLYDHMTDFWTPANPDARYPRLANIGSPSNTYNWRTGSDLYKYNAAYVRLKNLNIGYTIPKNITQKIGMERLRVSLIGQNILTLSKLKFIDPETTEFSNNLDPNSASNSARQYLLPKFYGAGLNITF